MPLGQLWLDKVIYVLEDVRPDVPVVLCAFQVCLCINHNDAREISQQHFHQQGGRRGADLFVWREAACSTADTLAAGESQVAWSMAESLGAGGNFLLCLRARFGSLAYLISSVFILSYSQI